MSTIITNRDIRQRELIPPEKLLDTKVTVVGVGAIGRQVALQLAAIGVPKIQIIDFDLVEAENLAAQGFYESDMGRSKVEAVADICKSINPAVEVTAANGKFRSMQFTSGILMCCVDGIDTRKSIFNSVKGRADLFIDGRMSAEYMRILTAYNNESQEYYSKTLFPAIEAYQNSCTSKTTIYCANIAAGMMVAQFAKWLRGHDLDIDIDVNLLTNEMGVK